MHSLLEILILWEKRYSTYLHIQKTFSCFFILYVKMISVTESIKPLNTINKTIWNIFLCKNILICCFILMYLWCWKENKVCVQFWQWKGLGCFNHLCNYWGHSSVWSNKHLLKNQLKNCQNTRLTKQNRS